MNKITDHELMRIWAIANQKGGVGKTTTTVALGGLLAARGRRVLLLDLDPHGSLTAYFGLDPDTQAIGMYDLFMEHKRLTRDALLRAACATNQALLHFFPGQVALATLEKQMVGQDGVGLIVQRIAELLHDDFDDILLDCPPVLGILMVNALAACDILLIPVQTEFLAIQGLQRMLRTLAMVERSRKQPIFRRIVPTQFDRRTRASVQCLRQLRDSHPEAIWRSVIPVDTRLREASRAHLVPSQFENSSRGVQAYAQLLRDVETQFAAQATPAVQMPAAHKVAS